MALPGGAGGLKLVRAGDCLGRGYLKAKLRNTSTQTIAVEAAKLDVTLKKTIKGYGGWLIR